MSHDVFISFSSVNDDVARKVCDALEESGEIKCWIAFRDIIPSANYAEQLVEAIESCKLLLLILSDESNQSPQVSREIERAGSKGIPILPLRIEDVALSKSMEYFISSHHWLDAFEEDIEEYLPALKTAVESSILGRDEQQSGTDASTRKKVSRPSSKGITPQKIFGAGVALTVLVVGFYLLKPDQSTSPIEQTASQPPPVPQVAQTTSPASSQDALIQELAQRYKENKAYPKAETDGWSSSFPISIAFLDVSGSGVNDAEIDFILNRTGDELRESKRYSIVEREMIDKLLEELNLSSSDLADPTTALKLGRILSAQLIVTGSLSKQDEQWLANLRFIESETTAIKCSVSTIVTEGGAAAVVSELGKAINSKLRKEFPLQGKITSVSGETASINIGDVSGVSTGMVFTLLQDNNTALDVATVTTVEPEQSQIALASNSVAIEKGMRLREDIQE
jgi:hypothetical protein